MKNNEFRDLKKRLKKEHDYAWSFQCNIAMAIMDSNLLNHERSNRAAAEIMSRLFDVNVLEFDEFKSLERDWNSQTFADLQDTTAGPHRELGIIRAIQFGMIERDVGIMLVVSTMSGDAQLSFRGSDALEFTARADVGNINNLVGKPCIVEIHNSIMRFVEMFK